MTLPVSLSLRVLLATGLLLAGSGCLREDSSSPAPTRPVSRPAAGEAAGGESPDSGDSAAPTPLARPMTEMASVETLTEEAANRLIEFSDAVRRRDFGKARGYLTSEFRGSGLVGVTDGPVEQFPLGVTRRVSTFAADQLPALDRDAFLGSLEALLAPLVSIEHVFLKTRGAEFENAESLEAVARGLVRWTFHVIGRRADGAVVSLYGWANGEVRRVSGEWCAHRLLLNKFRVIENPRPLFTDVAAAAGLAHRLPQMKNQRDPNFYWQGTTSADVDGDGLWDIFASDKSRNFLYLNRGDGTFRDAAEESGLATPGGTTTPLFFDADRDGDLDLFCAHVGWTRDGVPSGESLRLYRNDGEGHFEDVTAAAGLERYMPAFSAAIADVDGDGHLDIFVCGYNRLDAEYPNHWFAATNGTPNALFRNRGDGTFEDIAKRAGVDGTAWTYAAAFADFDEDGDEDLYVANDYGDNNLFLNDGSGTFTDVAAERGVLDNGNGMAAAWGDLDDDGRLDLYVSNMSSSAGKRILGRLMKKDASSTAATLYKGASGNTIFRNAGTKFERLPSSAGGVGASWAWGAALADLDLDGDLDIYVANGFISGDSLKDT